MGKVKKHIIVVDDVTTNLHYIGEVLKDKYTLSMAKSASQALKMMEKNKPDLLLLDIKMPVMDGYQMMETVRKDPRFVNIPVIFLTADNENGSESKCLQMGASDFIRKPFVPEVMLSRIERVLVQEEKNNEIRMLAYKDPLTGLWNRKYMEEKVADFSLQGMKGSFLLLDLDNFKGINDTYGHVVGDAALMAFGKTLSSFIHHDDVVSRVGGDEFAVFLKNAVGEEQLSERINGLISDVEKAIHIVKEDDSISSVSVGIAKMPEDGTTFIELYNNADKALYYVKRNGKHGYRFFTGDEKVNLLTEGEEDRSVIDLSQLRNYIDEKEDLGGPYSVEYDSFKNIYQFLKRYAARTQSSIQIILFTLKDLNLNEENEDYSESMKLLEEAIHQSLRKNDVSSRYTNDQFLVILMDVSENNRKLVVDRIIHMWERRNKNLNVLLKYDIEEILDDNKGEEETT